MAGYPKIRRILRGNWVKSIKDGRNQLRLCDLQRHTAIHVTRSRAPIEIVSKMFSDFALEVPSYLL
jgi:hypothetical protein